MPRNIYTIPPAEPSAYNRHVGARKPPSLRGKEGADSKWLVVAAIVAGVLIAWWLTESYTGGGHAKDGTGTPSTLHSP